MKSLLVLTALAVTTSAFAFSPARSTPPAALPAPQIVPESVVAPIGLPREAAGTLVHIEFSLDASGQPQAIRIPVQDAVLKRQLLQAFSQWRFAPAKSDTPAPANQRFVLPLKLKPEEV